MCKCNKLFTYFMWKDLETLDPKELPNTPGILRHTHKTKRQTNKRNKTTRRKLSEENKLETLQTICPKQNK